jgi:UDP-2,3-diacylglucosamine hydrolase
MTKDKIYFASDFHLGVDAAHSSAEREKLIISWLDKIKEDASELYLVGDIFDFWFGYSTVIPKGYIRFFGKLAELRDEGLPIYFFTGNHDMWMFSYFPEELGIPIYRNNIEIERNGKKFLIGHGDGLGPGDYGYKFIKKVFANKINQFLFKWFHPDLGIRIAEFWSGKSRESVKNQTFLGPNEEWLIQYCNKKIETESFDYLIFGHRHLPIDFKLKNDSSRYINLGDWLHHYSYAVFDGEDLTVQFYQNEKNKLYGI